MFGKWLVSIFLALSTGEWPGLTDTAERYFAPLVPFTKGLFDNTPNGMPYTMRVVHMDRPPRHGACEEFYVMVTEAVDWDSPYWEYGNCRAMLGCANRCVLTWRVVCVAVPPSEFFLGPPWCQLVDLDRSQSSCSTAG